MTRSLRCTALLSLPLLALAVGCGMEANLGDDGAGGSGGAGDGEGVAPEGEGEGGEVEAGQLTAGEWRDLDRWDYWLDLLKKPELAAYAELWGFATEQRYSVVVSADGVPLADAGVVLLGPDEAPVWRARTDVRGEAELFAGLFGDAVEGPFSISVETSAGAQLVEEVSAGPVDVEVEGAQPDARLDLMFVVDTTGSMGDELSYLQAELASVIERVRAEIGETVEIRLSVNFYRDEGDEYVVRAFPFTGQIDDAIADLQAQDAGGGGDTPEAVHSALADAIDEHAWSEAATARLCFLVLDAPPHEDAQVLASVRESVRRAAAKGVRIVPLAASGIDQATEFLLRFQAIATGGTYTFLTDHSGLGESHLEPTVGEYEVERLDDQMVRLITAALTP